MPDQKTLDLRFMAIAKEVSTWSKCLSRHVGSVLVKDGHIISTGYNGAACKVPNCDMRNDKGEYQPQTWHDEPVEGSQYMFKIVHDFEPVYVCPRQRMGFKSGEGLEHCVAVHGEVNSILQCAKFGIVTEGTTLYCFCNIPCINCTKEIINAGIKRVVCLEDIEYNQKLSSKLMFSQAGVELNFLGALDKTS